MRTEDWATSTAPAVQRQINRLEALSAGADGLGLDRITRLLARLDNPQKSLPPVFHVAGTNGKGSTCAFLRAALEADGRTVHVYTSPHLIRFNERIRLGGELIDDDVLAETLEDVLDIAADIGPSFFEATTAAAFLAFSREPADACVIEVGLGGRLDATNVIDAPVSTGIAQLALDHQAFLGDDQRSIAREKAGIAKPGVPLVTMAYGEDVSGVVGAKALTAGAQWLPMGKAWRARADSERLHYADELGSIILPLPALAGAHQAMNLGLATAMLRHQRAVPVSLNALKAAPKRVRWPARLQRLEQGPVAAALGYPECEIWLDGGHNPAAAEMLARHFAATSGPPKPTILILGMLASKDPMGFVTALRGQLELVHVVPISGHDCHDPHDLANRIRGIGLPAVSHATLQEALAAIGRQKAAERVLIAGSLHLAGDVLQANGNDPA